MYIENKIYIYGIKMTTRNWTLTIYDFSELISFHDSRIRYAAYGDEVCPTTKREHKQAFVCFSHAMRFVAVKKLFPTSHIEPMRGRLEDNQKYCSKEGQLTEFGSRPMSKSDQGKKGHEYWVEQKRLAEIDIDLVSPSWYCNNPRAVERVHAIARSKRKLPTLDKLEHEWFVGDSGTGKSSTARKENPDAYIKQCNKWWDGYADEEVVIIDDLDPSHEYMGYLLNQWADHYPFPAEVKGGQTKIRPRKLIITSRYTPDQIFKDISMFNSINRRFKFRHF